MSLRIVYILSVLFLATFVRSAFGFGEALIAVPLLALVLPVVVAAPVAALVSITVAAVAVAQDWRHIHLRSASWLIASTVFGIPLGLLLLTTVAEPIVKGLLGVIIVAFSSYVLVAPRPAELDDDRFAWIFGLGAGVLGGAYGMNGPPLVVYGSLRGWSPQHFRATLQAYFLPASILVACGYWVGGVWNGTVTRYFVTALPLVFVAVILGRIANRRMSGRAFIVAVHGLLIAVGVTLVWQAIKR